MDLLTAEKKVLGWYLARKSVHFMGPPGIGKTTLGERCPAIVGNATGKKLGLVVINGAMLTPMDVLGYGIPKHYENHTEMLFSDPFFWRTTEGKRLEEYDGGIILVDEADKADPDVKKVLGEGRLSGRFGPHRLPHGWQVWSTGNREEDRSGTTKDFDHEINRMKRIPIQPSFPAWKEWAEANGVAGPTIVFAQEHPDIVFSGKVPEKQGPFCTPRSLVDEDRYLYGILSKIHGEVPIEDPSLIEDVAGGIGMAAASQYLNTVRLDREMPSYEQIVKKPDTTKVPTKPDAIMLVVYKLAHNVKKDETEPVVKYVERLPKEFTVTFANAACKRDPSLIMAPGIQKWCKDNATLVTTIAS